MAVISLKSLPVGFRFQPKDEELVNYYLKGKINGGKGGIDVIPEVDVCKCEPWELPGKSLIQTQDAEWFFFSPRNRKYPTGNRSKRATEKGYWKATGRDRKIRTRTASGETVIGMKKTLVFHRGRAPKGDKTEWILHEYRVTDPSSAKETNGANDGQGAYVLCRLFNQHEKKGPSPDCQEVEDSALSPASTKSSPSDAQHPQTAVEVSETLSNQEIIEPDMQEDLSLLPAAVGMRPEEIENQLVDEAESAASYPLKPEQSNCDNMASDFEDHKGEVVTEIYSLLHILNEPYEPQSETKYLDDFARLESPVCLDDFLKTFPESGQTSMAYGLVTAMDGHTSHSSMPQGLDDCEVDEVTEFLDSVLNQDDHSSGEFYDQNEQVINTISNSAADSELRILQNQDHGLHLDAGVSKWSYKQPLLSQNLNNSSHGIPLVRPSENIYGRGDDNQFVGDATGPPVFSMASATETQLYAYNISSIEKPSTQKSSPSNNNELEGTGIKIRPRQRQLPAPSLIWQQGTADRRIRLRVNHQVESVCSNDADEGTSFEEHEVCSAKTEEQEEEHVKMNSDHHHMAKEEKLFRLSSVDCAESHLPVGTHFADLTATLSEVVEEAKPRLRPKRSKDCNGSTGYPPRKEVVKLGVGCIRSIAWASLSLISSVVLIAVAWDCFKR